MAFAKISGVFRLLNQVLERRCCDGFCFQTFEEAKLCESLENNISRSGYVKPTPVQKYGLPIISAGRDLMACAQTGSGKTVRPPPVP